MAASSTDHADEGSLFGSPILLPADLEPEGTPEIKDMAASTGTALTTEQPCSSLETTGETEPSAAGKTEPAPTGQTETEPAPAEETEPAPAEETEPVPTGQTELAITGPSDSVLLGKADPAPSGECVPSPGGEVKPGPAEPPVSATVEGGTNDCFTDLLNSLDGFEMPAEEIEHLMDGIMAESCPTLSQPAPMHVTDPSITHQNSAANIEALFTDSQLIQGGDFALESLNQPASGTANNNCIAPGDLHLPQIPVTSAAETTANNNCIAPGDLHLPQIPVTPATETLTADMGPPLGPQVGNVSGTTQTHAEVTEKQPLVASGQAGKQLQWFEAKESSSMKKSRRKKEREGRKKRNRDENQGKDEGSDEDCDTMVYQTYPRPAAWGLANNKQPTFRYSTRGQWSVGTYYTTEELRFYVANCPRNLTVWVQSIPNSNQRQDLWDRICRWSECPDKGYPVSPGFYRCTFDEYPQLTSNEKKDPYFVAGCVHLYCFEKIFDTAKLHRRGRLMPDLRILEGRRNPMALDRHPDTLVEEDVFVPWMKEQPDGNAVPSENWVPQSHEKTLGYALTSYHAKLLAKRSNGGGGQAAPKRQRSRAKTLAEHLGDLQAYVDSAGKDRQRRRRDLVASADVRPSESSTDSDDESVADSHEPDTDEDATDESGLEEENSEENSEDDCDAELQGYAIEGFQAQRKRYGQTQYQVKWKDYEETSWEPATSLKRDLSRKDFNEFLSAMPKTTKATHKVTKEKGVGTKSKKIKSLEAEIERLVKMVEEKKHLESKRKPKRVREPSTEDGDSDDEVIVVKRRRTDQQEPARPADLEPELTNAEKKSNGKRKCVAGNVQKKRARESRSSAMADSDHDGSEPEERASKRRRHSKVSSQVKTAAGKRSRRTRYSRHVAEQAPEREESEDSEEETPSRKRRRLAN